MQTLNNQMKLRNGKVFHLRYKLEASIGEERAYCQTYEVGEHFWEVGLFSYRNESQTQQWGQINDGNSQEAKSPYCVQKERGGLTQLKLYIKANDISSQKEKKRKLYCIKKEFLKKFFYF